MVVFEWTFGTTQNQSNGGAGTRVEADNNRNATDKPWRQFIRNESENTRDLHSFRMTYFCHVPSSTTPEATILASLIRVRAPNISNLFISVAGSNYFFITLNGK